MSDDQGICGKCRSLAADESFDLQPLLPPRATISLVHMHNTICHLAISAFAVVLSMQTNAAELAAAMVTRRSIQEASVSPVQPIQVKLGL